MFYFFASVAPAWTRDFATAGDKAYLGTTMFLLGATIVFLLLILIMLSIEVLPILFGEKKTKKAAAPAPVPLIEETDGPAHDEEDVIPVVIAAALAAYLESGTETMPDTLTGSAGFRVRRIRRIG